MDEPLSNLDAKLRVGMRAELASLHARLGATTVYVTHDQVEAMTLGERVAVMRDGRIQQVDTPQTLYRRPGEPLRRRVHRLARDEPRRGAARRRRRSSSAATASRSAPEHLPATSKERIVLGIRPESLRGRALRRPVAAAARRRGRRCSRTSAPTRTSSSRSMRRRFTPRSCGAITTRRRCSPATAPASPPASTSRLRRAPGAPLRLAVDPAGFHYFDRETGESCRSGAGSEQAAQPLVGS